MKLPIAVTFENKNFHFKNGRLKYCPNLISPYHNIVESKHEQSSSKLIGSSKQHKSGMGKYDNIVFLNRLILQFLHSNDNSEGQISNSMLFQLMPIIADFDNYSLDSTSAFIAFIVRLKKITKTCISENPWKTFNAKLVIQKNYSAIDNRYICHLN